MCSNSCDRLPLCLSQASMWDTCNTHPPIKMSDGAKALWPWYAICTTPLSGYLALLYWSLLCKLIHKHMLMVLSTIWVATLSPPFPCILALCWAWICHLVPEFHGFCFKAWIIADPSLVSASTLHFLSLYAPHLLSSSYSSPLYLNTHINRLLLTSFTYMLAHLHWCVCTTLLTAVIPTTPNCGFCPRAWLHHSTCMCLFTQSFTNWKREI